MPLDALRPAHEKGPAENRRPCGVPPQRASRRQLMKEIGPMLMKVGYDTGVLGTVLKLGQHLGSRPATQVMGRKDPVIGASGSRVQEDG